MSRKIAIFSILIVAIFGGLPISGSASTAVNATTLTTGSPPMGLRNGQPGRRHHRRGYWGHGRYYKNYGQYRRTQVGWRRYRMAPRYYWRDGRRYTTFRRVYYFR
ncbi:MAG TPA: hypothetical protein VJV05_07450 [Pyrinomonadaceae bacterium]|nr:hypothetical protein [Pyrinomonadaceae bacterium]